MNIHLRETCSNNSRRCDVWLNVPFAEFTRFIYMGQFSVSEKQLQICLSVFKEDVVEKLNLIDL